MMALLLSSVPFLQPTTADAYLSYLCGDWKVRKVVTFQHGGPKGRFSGSASFSVLDAEAPKLLSYCEAGIFTTELEGVGERETRNRLLYDFSDWQKVNVLSTWPRSRRRARHPRAGELLYTLRPDAAVAGTAGERVAADGDEGNAYWGDLGVCEGFSQHGMWTAQASKARSCRCCVAPRCWCGGVVERWCPLRIT